MNREFKLPVWLAWCTLAAATLTGCSRPQLYLSWSRLDRGLVIVLSGIEGRSKLNEAICAGLNDGGVNWGIDLCDWTSSVPMNYLVNLRDQERNRIKAEEIAAKVVRYKMAHPERTVVLVGQSGGGAIAIWVAEAMPPGEKLDGVIVLSAALSPEYPLDKALANTKRGIISYYSSRDWFLLGVGTIISGTMDGEHSSSAGRLGFAVPSSGKRAKAYEKLYQIPWQREMALSGYSGGHLTSGAREFVAAYAAPFVLAAMWDRNFVEMVGKRRTDESLFLPPPQPRNPSKPVSGGQAPSAVPSPATRPARPYPGPPAAKR